MNPLTTQTMTSCHGGCGGVGAGGACFAFALVASGLPPLPPQTRFPTLTPRRVLPLMLLALLVAAAAEAAVAAVMVTVLVLGWRLRSFLVFRPFFSFTFCVGLCACVVNGQQRAARPAAQATPPSTPRA